MQNLAWPVIARQAIGTEPAGLPKRPTIGDLARQARVGVATVDRVLNGRHPVREQTATLVLSAAETPGYRAAPPPDSPAQAFLPFELFAAETIRTAAATPRGGFGTASPRIRMAANAGSRYKPRRRDGVTAAGPAMCSA